MELHQRLQLSDVLIVMAMISKEEPHKCHVMSVMEESGSWMKWSRSSAHNIEDLFYQ